MITLLQQKPQNRSVAMVQIENVPCPQGCCPFTVHIRPSTSDVHVLRMLLQGNEYGFLHELDWQPEAILDAGANTGIAASLFATLFPGATIVAVEPDPSNFRVLQLNVARFDNVHTVQAGLWNKVVGLKVVRDCPDPDAWWCGAWTYAVKEVPAADADVAAVTIDQLLETHSLPAFEYVKIDIEGSERVVLSDRSAAGWLARCKLASIEVHGGATTDSIVREFFTASDFRNFKHGEYEVFIRHQI